MSLRPMTGKEAVEFAKLARDWMLTLGLLERTQHPAHEVADYIAADILTNIPGSELLWDVPIELSEADMLLEDKDCECKGCCVPVTSEMIVETVS